MPTSRIEHPELFEARERDFRMLMSDFVHKSTRIKKELGDELFDEYAGRISEFFIAFNDEIAQYQSFIKILDANLDRANELINIMETELKQIDKRYQTCQQEIYIRNKIDFAPTNFLEKVLREHYEHKHKGFDFRTKNEFTN